MDRLLILRRFYAILSELEVALSGKRCLSDCSGRMGWPQRGVYFFFEPGEERSDSGAGLRVVRVGTHALTSGARSSLWQRLGQHKGQERSGGGNHRGSIFRLLVGTAMESDYAATKTWGVKGDAKSAARKFSISHSEVRQLEHDLEYAVSRYIRAMPFLWLEIDDPASPESDRGTIERNSIALLSNFAKPVLDAPSPAWLGHKCTRDRVRRSGLWNNNHVDEAYDLSFVDTLEKYVRDAARSR